MKKKISYSTTFTVYYTYGSMYTGNITSDSITDMTNKIVSFRNSVKDGFTELVTFSPIEKITSSYARKGLYTKFKPITNRYMGGNKSVDPKYFEKLS